MLLALAVAIDTSLKQVLSDVIHSHTYSTVSLLANPSACPMKHLSHRCEWLKLTNKITLSEEVDTSWVRCRFAVWNSMSLGSVRGFCDLGMAALGTPAKAFCLAASDAAACEAASLASFLACKAQHESKLWPVVHWLMHKDMTLTALRVPTFST